MNGYGKSVTNNTRLYGLVFLISVLGVCKASAQTNLFLNTPGYKHAAMPYSVQEYKGSLYFINCYRKVVQKYTTPRWNNHNYTALYSVTKKGISGNTQKSV